MKFKSLADQLAECSDEEIRQLYVAGRTYFEKNLDMPASPFYELCEISSLSTAATFDRVAQEIIRRWMLDQRIADVCNGL